MGEARGQTGGSFWIQPSLGQKTRWRGNQLGTPSARGLLPTQGTAQKTGKLCVYHSAQAARCMLPKWWFRAGWWKGLTAPMETAPWAPCLLYWSFCATSWRGHGSTDGPGEIQGYREQKAPICRDLNEKQRQRPMDFCSGSPPKSWIEIIELCHNRHLCQVPGGAWGRTRKDHLPFQPTQKPSWKGARAEAAPEKREKAH